jgi:hypothetical protein
MESFFEADGFLGLDKVPFEPGRPGRFSGREAAGLVRTAMAPLFACYEASVNRRYIPNIYED